MDPEKEKQAQENLKKIKEYIEGVSLYPGNAAMRYVHECVGITLELFEDETEEKESDDFDLPQSDEKKEPEPESKPKTVHEPVADPPDPPKPSVPLPEPAGFDQPMKKEK